MADRRHFFVKHGLDALTVMPTFIWRTDEAEEPAAFRRVRQGDRWIGFAYTTSDSRERALSQITGFYECIQESTYGRLPQRALPIAGGCQSAWMIEGKPFGKQPEQPVGVPSIDDLLRRPTFKQSTLVPVGNAEEYEWIRQYVLAHELRPSDIPLLQREPRNEQEVLAVVLSCYERLGIERILRVQTAFPDLQVKLKGRAEPVHLELETYSSSYLTHGHDRQVRNRRFEADGLPVAIMCWIDDAKGTPLSDRVHQVYELQQLIREKGSIGW